MILAGLLIFATTTVFGMNLSQMNKASKAELMQINGVGKVKAEAIIKERRKGKFKSFDDLSSRVKGIGKQVSANIKNGTKSADKVKKVKSSSSSSKSSTSKVKKDKKTKMTKTDKVTKLDAKKLKAKKAKAAKEKKRKLKAKKEKAKKLKAKKAAANKK